MRPDFHTQNLWITTFSCSNQGWKLSLKRAPFAGVRPWRPLRLTDPIRVRRAGVPTCPPPLVTIGSRRPFARVRPVAEAPALSIHRRLPLLPKGRTTRIRRWPPSVPDGPHRQGILVPLGALLHQPCPLVCLCPGPPVRRWFAAVRPRLPPSLAIGPIQPLIQNLAIGTTVRPRIRPETPTVRPRGPRVRHTIPHSRLTNHIRHLPLMMNQTDPRIRLLLPRLLWI